MNSGKNTDNSIRLTKHACKRARQRYRWNSQTLNRIALRAFESGLKSNNTKGYLKNYLDQTSEEHCRTSNLRLYGETVFVFYNNILITLWALPPELRSLAKVFRVKNQHSITSA